MRKLGQNPTEEELQEMISSVDDNGDKEIDFEEFLILMKSRCLEQDPEKELRDAFAVFDTDGSGSIDRKELKRLMKKLGQALTEAEVDAMMDEVDSNGDGEISYEEFKYMMVRACPIVCFIACILCKKIRPDSCCVVLRCVFIYFVSEESLQLSFTHSLTPSAETILLLAPIAITVPLDK